MNLEQSDSFKEQIEKNTRQRKSVMLSIVLCAFLIAFLFILIMILRYQDSITEKLFLDDKQVSIPKDFYRDIEGKTYINVKEISSLLGYSYTKGEYNKYNENEDSAYLTGNFEIVALTAESGKYEKYIQTTGNDLMIAEIPVTIKSEPNYYEVFSLENPVKFVDGNLYVSLDSIQDMFNIGVEWKEYRKRIYSLDYIVQSYKPTIANLEKNQISGYYENLKALLYGYAIVGNGTAENAQSTAFGVVNLSEGKEIISVKYTDIKFIQNVKEFYIKIAEGGKGSAETMGILSSEGSTIIAPSTYNEISVLDAEKQLYLVKKGNKLGVVNRNGKEIVFPEFEEIGYDVTAFENDDIDNPYLLYGKVIPVKGLTEETEDVGNNSNNKESLKYGFYGIEGGEPILKLNYDSLGYKTSSSKNASARESNVLLIPETVGVRGIVVCFDGLYGIFDVDREELILPCVYTKIYSVTKSGVTTYYAEFNDEQLELSKYLEENNLVNVELSKVESNTSEETINSEENVNTEETANNQENINVDDQNSSKENE